MRLRSGLFGTVALGAFALVLLFIPVTSLSSADAQEVEPKVKFLTPQEDDILRKEAEILVATEGFRELDTIGSAYFEYSPDGKSWTLIGQDTRSRDGRFRMSWDTTRVSDGSYFLRVTVQGLYDQRASAEVEVIVDNAMKLPFFLVPRDLTLDEALRQAPPGAVIRLDARKGPFQGSFTIAQDGLVLEGLYGLAELDGQGADVVLSVDADEVTIRNLRVLGGRTGLLAQGDGLTVTGSEFIGPEAEAVLPYPMPLGVSVRNVAVRLRDANDALLQGNAFNGAFDRVVQVEASSYVKILENSFKGGCAVGVEAFAAEMVALEGNSLECAWGIVVDSLSKGLKIEDNDITAMYGVIISGGQAEHLIEGNVIESSDTALWIAGNAVITANALSSRGTEGQVGIELCCGGRARIQGNRISGFRIGIKASFFRTAVLRSNEITRNIIGLQISAFSLLPDNPTPTLEIRENNFVGNLKFGLQVVQDFELPPFITLRPLDARHNWWGDPSGPFHPERNPEGRGDRVSDLVRFEPWLTEPVAIP